MYQSINPPIHSKRKLPIKATLFTKASFKNYDLAEEQREKQKKGRSAK